MNNHFLYFLLLFPFCLLGQVRDSAAIAEVDSLIELSRAMTDEQDFVGALAVNEIAERITLEKIGKESASYGNTCFNHGRVLYFEGRYPEAEPWYLESKAVRQKILGTNHADYGKSLNNLAILYDEMSRYEEAEPLYLETVALREKLLGKNTPSYAAALSNLASLYTSLGEYEKAEKLTLEAKDIRAKVLGKEHPDYAASLNNLANLYFSMGNYGMAEPLYLESIAIREAANDMESADYATGLDNLGALYQFMGRYSSALQYLKDALDLRAKIVGDKHPDYLLNLHHLADLYKSMGQYDQAARIFLKVKDIDEKVLGKQDINYALNLAKLSELYLEKGQFDLAFPYCVTYNSIIEKVLGKEHPYFVTGLENLARVQWAKGDIAAASSLLLEAAPIRRKLLIKASRHLSERELAAYTQNFVERLKNDYSFALTQPDMAGNCYNNLLFHKGFLLNAALQIGKLAGSNPKVNGQYYLLKSYHRQLAAEYAKPSNERANTLALEEKANDLEKVLAKDVAGLGNALRQINWQEVQAALGANEAAIEFVHFPYITPRLTDSTIYMALVVKPGASQPEVVPLFEEKLLLELLNQKGESTSDFVNDIYGSKQLFPLIWQPLNRLLEGTETVYFSPSGLLHRINLGAIPTSTPGEVLSDRLRLIQMGSTRQLVIVEPTADTAASTALLYGGIHYDEDSLAIDSNSTKLKEPPTPASQINFSDGQMDSTTRGGNWDYLKWTAVEVEAIKSILEDAGLRAEARIGYDATEESFKDINAQVQIRKTPRILHLATHGFFFPSKKTTTVAQTIGGGNGAVFKNSEHPMMRAGLVLAGGNHAWQYGQPIQSGKEDGILTAYEISHMNLSGTDLVVLSACETGLGELSDNEGVYGLQRAFKIAGVKYLIMSLWQVPDFQTQELMTAFYAHWLEDGMTIPDAFRLAQKEMRNKYKAPFYWAGFVLLS